MNNLINTLYWNAWAKLDVNEENGAEAIEWIAMVAVLLIILLAMSPILEDGGIGWAGDIVDLVGEWVANFAAP